MKKKRYTEAELVRDLTPETAHVDELAVIHDNEWEPALQAEDMNTQRLLEYIETNPNEFGSLCRELLKQADGYFGNRSISLKWLNSQSPAFGNASPISICNDPDGINSVLNELNKLKHGFSA